MAEVLPELETLADLSQAAGRDLLLAQGGGGNTSIKSAGGARMWIKASGLRLSQLRPDFGGLATDLPALLALLRDPAVAALSPASAHQASVNRIQAAVLDGGSLRPSLETTFHAVLGRVVLHTHPVYLNAFTCMRGGKAALTKLLGSQLVWVPYAAPGFALGLAVDHAVQAHVSAHGRLPEAVILENHGLIASGDSAAGVLALTERLVNLARDHFGPLPAGALDLVDPPTALAAWADGLAAALPATHPLVVRPARRVALLAADAHSLTAGPLVPDVVVYCGRQVWLGVPTTRPADWLARHPAALAQAGKAVIALPGLGPILAGPSHAFLDALEENLLAHILVRHLIARRGEAQPLPQPEIDTLANMESEAYRQGIASAALSLPPK